MSRVTTVTCDECGADATEASAEIRNVVVEFRSVGERFFVADLCPDCRARLHTVLRKNFPGVAQR